MKRATLLSLLFAALVAVSACGGDPDPVAVPTPPGPPPGAFPGSATDAATPTRPPNPPPIPRDSAVSSSPLGAWDTMSIDEINSAADAPLKPIYYAYDSDEISDEAQETLAANAEVLKQYESWVIT